MESVLGEDCQDPIPAMLTLKQAEMQGRDWTDPAQGMGARAAAAGTAQVAGPAWSFVGSHLPGSPKLTGTSVPSCVVGPQARNSAMLIGKNSVVLGKLRRQGSKKGWRNGRSSCPWPAAKCWLQGRMLWVPGEDLLILGSSVPPCTRGRARPGRVLL